MAKTASRKQRTTNQHGATVDNLKPHQQRVIDEKAELDEKVEKLGAFIHSDAFTNVETEERARLYRQFVVMKNYAKILGERIAAF